MKNLSRAEMKNISGGKALLNDYNCTCGNNAPITGVVKCSCAKLCDGTCTE